MELINDTLNGVRVWKNDDGKYGLEDTIGAPGVIKFRHSSIEQAENVARDVSAENDLADNG